MLTVTLRPSFLLAALLLLMHGLAMASVWLVPLHSAAKIVAAICLALSLLHALWRHVLRRGMKAVQAIRWQEESKLSVQEGGGGQWQEAELLPSSFVSAYLVVLNLRLAEEKWARHVVILPDGIEAEQFRQLRVNLRWKYRPSPG